MSTGATSYRAEPLGVGFHLPVVSEAFDHLYRGVLATVSNLTPYYTGAGLKKVSLHSDHMVVASGSKHAGILWVPSH